MTTSWCCLALALACGLAQAGEVVKIDITPLLEHIALQRKLADIRAVYFVQLPEDNESAINLHFDVVMKDVGAYRYRWSPWNKATLPRPAEALPLADVTDTTVDVRLRGVSIAQGRNQHQRLYEGTGEMLVWSFESFDLEKGVRIDDRMIAGAQAVAKDYAFNQPLTRPLANLSHLFNKNPMSWATRVGPWIYSCQAADLKKLLSTMFVSRIDRPDGRVELGFLDPVVPRMKDCLVLERIAAYDSWVVVGAKHDNNNPNDPDVTTTSYTYTTIICGTGQRVPLLSKCIDNPEHPYRPDAGRMILVSHKMDPDIRLADVEIDSSKAKGIFDLAVGMQREPAAGR